MKPMVAEKLNAINYIKTNIYLLYYYIIALSQILSTLQIIPHLGCHKPTKSDSDNQHCNNLSIYIHIYISSFIHLIVWNLVIDHSIHAF